MSEYGKVAVRLGSWGSMLAIAALWSGSALAAPGAKAAAAANIDPLTAKLQAFLTDTKQHLGPLEPWQSRLFDDEILSDAKRFIRDYKASKTGVEAEADMDAIKRYLRFY